MKNCCAPSLNNSILFTISKLDLLEPTRASRPIISSGLLIFINMVVLILKLIEQIVL